MHQRRAVRTKDRIGGEMVNQDVRIEEHRLAGGEGRCGERCEDNDPGNELALIWVLGQLRRHHLQSNRPLQLGVLCQENFAHASGTKPSDNPVVRD